MPKTAKPRPRKPYSYAPPEPVKSQGNWEDAIVDLACLQSIREYCRANQDTCTMGREYDEDFPAEMRDFLERFYFGRMPHWTIITARQIILGWDGGNGMTEEFSWR